MEEKTSFRNCLVHQGVSLWARDCMMITIWVRVLICVQSFTLLSLSPSLPSHPATINVLLSTDNVLCRHDKALPITRTYMSGTNGCLMRSHSVEDMPISDNDIAILTRSVTPTVCVSSSISSISSSSSSSSSSSCSSSSSDSDMHTFLRA